MNQTCQESEIQTEGGKWEADGEYGAQKLLKWAELAEEWEESAAGLGAE